MMDTDDSDSNTFTRIYFYAHLPGLWQSIPDRFRMPHYDFSFFSRLYSGGFKIRELCNIYERTNQWLLVKSVFTTI